MDWFLSIVRIAGVAFPVASSLVQLQTEIDSKALKERVARLEDPVSYLHNDVPELSRELYRELKLKNTDKIYFDEQFYSKYSRALAALESQGYIKGSHAIGKRFAAGIRLVDPSYIMYLCALEEDDVKMDALLKVVDNCKVGEWLEGRRIQERVDLPLPVIRAVFDIYESKGYGLCSKEISACQYLGKA